MNEQLTLQQQRFCDEYLVSFNAFQSALKAGYSENTARKCELLHLPKVQAYLKAGMAKTAERLEITHDKILHEFAKVAFANMGDYYDENAVLKPMNQLTPDQKAAIKDYQLIDAVGDYGERAGELSKIKLHNKLSALDKIARHTGFYLAGSLKREALSKILAGQISAEVEEDVTEVGSQMDGALQTHSQVKHPLQTSAIGGEVEKNLTLSPPDNMEDGKGKMEDVGGDGKNKVPGKGMVWAKEPGRWATVRAVTV